MKKAVRGIRLVYIGGVVVPLIGLTALLVGPLLWPVWAEVKGGSKIYRYRERVASGYYEGYEVSPRRARATVERPSTRRGLASYGASSARVRIRTRLPDSHRGLKFYYRNSCIECHPKQTRNLHSVRAGITCRQCHGAEPIAAIKYHYSPMNPIRRHAYVCSKCHEGANVAFGTYLIHEPRAESAAAKENFPVLYYAYWMMLLLLGGTLAFFIPHILMVFVQELAMKKKKPAIDFLLFFIPNRFIVQLREKLIKKWKPPIDKLIFFMEQKFVVAPRQLLSKIRKPANDTKDIH